MKAGGAPFLKSLINSTPPAFETEWLEFKGAEKIDANGIKNYWAEALSGFANTEGGVLVWGIDARKNEDKGIDCASALSLVPSLSALEARLKEIQPQRTNPPVNGVDYFSCPSEEGCEKGFVVCYIPEGNFKPYRTEIKKNPYYIRAGDSFHIPSVALLRSLFYPEYHSCLEAEVITGIDEKLGRVVAEFFINNRGVATAKNVVVAMKCNDSSVTIRSAGSWKELNTGFSKDLHRDFHCNFSLHPKSRSKCFIAHQNVILVGAQSRELVLGTRRETS